MSAQINTLSHSFTKLNEIGQMLLLINNMPILSPSEIDLLKELATKKDPEMTKSLNQFKTDQNFDILQATWKNLVAGTESGTSFLRKKTRDYKLPTVLSDPRRRPEPISNNLISLRTSIGLDRKNPKDLANQLKNIFQSKETLSFEDFSKTVLTLNSTSEKLANLNKIKALRALFDILDDNKSGNLSRNEAFNQLVMLSGGSQDEKISAFFMLNEESDGLISYDTVVEHLKQSISLCFAFDPSLKKPNISADSLALATADNLFSKIDCSVFKLVSEPEYIAWTHKSPVPDSAASDKSLRIAARIKKHEKLLIDLKSINSQFCSKENLKDIFYLKQATGLGKVPVSNALQMFKAKNSSGYFSRQQFTETIKELVGKYCKGVEPGSEFYSAVCKLFTKFDQDGNGVMDKAELFCGLSLVCAGTLGDKVYAACNSFDESEDGLMQYGEVQQYFKVVIKMILTDEALFGVDLNKLVSDTAENLFRYFSISKTEAVTADMIKKWLLVCKVKIH